MNEQRVNSLKLKDSKTEDRSAKIWDHKHGKYVILTEEIAENLKQWHAR